MDDERTDDEMLLEALAFDEKMLRLWHTHGTNTPLEWSRWTEPREDLIYRAGHSRQVKGLVSISHLLDLPVRVVGSHRSKSVELPVGMFAANICCEECVCFFTRNNFHDLKLVVVSSVPVDVPYDVVHTRVSQGWYDEEKQRSYEYCRPKPEKGIEGSHDWDETDYQTDAWYDKWTSGTLLRADGEIYRCGATFSGYYEGIDDLNIDDLSDDGRYYRRYEKGAKRFAVEVPGSEIEMMRIMQAVVRSAVNLVLERRQDQRDMEDYSRYCSMEEDRQEFRDWDRRRFAELKERLRERGVIPS
jgi:hypothetical protein